MAKKLTIKLPDPGLPADHHRDDQVVFYHGQHGEFLINGKVADPALLSPITDENGNTHREGPTGDGGRGTGGS